MTIKDLDEFAQQCAGACVELGAHAAGLFVLDVGLSDGNVMVLELHDADVTEIINRMLDEFHADKAKLGVEAPAERVGMATRTGFTPTEGEPSSEHWLLVCVEAGLPAVFAVCPVAHPEQGWALIDAAVMPWFALSTAGGLRKFLQGEKLVMRSASDGRLFNRIDEEAPPIYPDGRI